MLVEDYSKPIRLEKAKMIVLAIVKENHGEKINIVVFC
jgi:hypothetical protein